MGKEGGKVLQKREKRGAREKEKELKKARKGKSQKTT